MLRPERWAVEAKKATALEDAVDDGVGEIVIVQDVAPAPWMLVRREDHRASANVAVVDDVIEDVRRVVSVGEIANLVDHEHVRLHEATERVLQPPLTTRE